MSRWAGRSCKALFGAAGAGVGWAYGAKFVHAHQAGSTRTEQNDAQCIPALPSHLQTVQKRFRYYADSSDQGNPTMSARAFLRSVLGIDKDEPVSAATVEGLERRFDGWEKRNGGRLTFDAYATYQMMVRVSGADADRVFLMYDDNETNSLSKGQFRDMMDGLRLHADKTAQMDLTSGYADGVFGAAQDKELTADRWRNDLAGLKGDVWLSSFHHFDKANQGHLSPHDFAALALSSVGVTGTAAKRRLDKTFHPTGKETLMIEEEYDASAWVALNQLLNYRYRVEEMMHMGRGLFPLSPDRFYDILRACELKISRSQSDIIFAIFDRNGRRELSFADMNSTLYLFRRAVPSD